MLVALIPTLIITRFISYPLKKIERNMRTVASGKTLDPKNLKGYGKFSEIDDTMESKSKEIMTV